MVVLFNVSKCTTGFGPECKCMFILQIGTMCLRRAIRIQEKKKQTMSLILSSPVKAAYGGGGKGVGREG